MIYFVITQNYIPQAPLRPPHFVNKCQQIPVPYPLISLNTTLKNPVMLVRTSSIRGNCTACSKGHVLLIADTIMDDGLTPRNTGKNILSLAEPGGIY